MTSLDQLFDQWALRTPAHDALLGLEHPSLTFAQLGQQLRTLRASFRHLGLGRNARLALMAPNGPDLALAFLASATSAICAPLNPAYSREEIAFYLDDLDASALLIAGSLKSPAREVAHSRGIPILELHALPDQPAGCFALDGTTGLVGMPEQAAMPENIALILHTSGTTARPKQVPLSQANLCASIRHLQQSLALTPQDRCLNLMPLFHIHGLVGALLAALGSGGSMVCPPGFSAKEVFTWLHTFQPTWYTAVPTLHQAILAQARRNTTGGPVGRLRFIRSSSASLPPTVMVELEQVFGVPVIEAYGMTEAAHQMTSNPLPPGIRKPGSVGRPAGPEIAILSESGALLAVGEVGEVAIKGPNVMTGYRQNVEANVLAFTQKWFRTGDQGYLDPDGYLFLTGRLKELINRGGEKIAPVEIDQALLAHPGVQQAVTFAMPHSTLGEEVAAAVVLHENATVTEHELQNFLARFLADFKIPRRIAIVSEIPKGPTGKIQRIGLAEKLLDCHKDSLQKVEKDLPCTVLEQQIASLWSAILGQENIGLHDSFLQLGGDSISGAQLRSRIRDLFQLDLSWLNLFQDANTVAGLATFIQNHPQENGLSLFPPLVASPDHRQLPLAFAQEPLWLATQLDTENTAFNRSLILRLEGHLNVQALERSLNEIVRRHEALRTTFPCGPEGPRQLINPVTNNTLECCDLSHFPKPEVEEAINTLVAREVATRFDLIHGPVFRAIIFRVTDSDHRLMVIMHHLVSDGWSDGVFFQELEAIFNRFCREEPSPLPELSIQYGDFVLWQQQWLTGKTLESQLVYWKEQLGDWRSFQFLQGIKVSSNCAGKPSRREKIILSRFQTDSLKTFSRQEGVTSFTVLLAGFLLLLHRWTQKVDLTVGVPLANRIHPLLEPLIGLFANTLPFRSNIHWEQSFRTLLQQLHGTGLGVLSHADVPLQELRKALGHTEIFTGNSLFQVLFIFENAPQYFPRLTDVQCESLTLPNGELALVDLSLFLWDHPLGIQGHMVFNTDIFEQRMIQHLIKNYQVVLEEVIKNPEASLHSLHLDLSHIARLFQEKSPWQGMSQEHNPVPEVQSIKEKSVRSTGGFDSRVNRRESLQERVDKLSQSKQAALRNKLKKLLDPPST